jgi:hypothetical protein
MDKIQTLPAELIAKIPPHINAEIFCKLAQLAAMNAEAFDHLAKLILTKKTSKSLVGKKLSRAFENYTALELLVNKKWVSALQPTLQFAWDNHVSQIWDRENALFGKCVEFYADRLEIEQDFMETPSEEQLKLNKDGAPNMNPSYLKMLLNLHLFAIQKGIQFSETAYVLFHSAYAKCMLDAHGCLNDMSKEGFTKMNPEIVAMAQKLGMIDQNKMAYQSHGIYTVQVFIGTVRGYLKPLPGQNEKDFIIEYRPWFLPWLKKELARQDITLQIQQKEREQ